ncbi:MAG: hypothetical protein D6775_16600 [Caldilineae bacterium]|nr:MAG: hypothetical protein D6775_16600 [Caldilineae bacterium]
MSSSLGPLQDGGRVVIIGGGPGGVACALALQRQARQLGRRITVTILEGKQFSSEQHYNQCAGVLSPPLPALLKHELGLPFPYHLSRGEIKGYVLHTDGEVLLLPERGEPSIAVRRIQFDAFMLEAATQAHIGIIPARAVDVEFHADGVMVYTENVPLECDVVVGAFGLDEGSAAFFARSTGYHPPRFLDSVVTKYHPGVEAMEAFGPYIHAFLPADPAIEFGAITPKGNHLTINIAGRRVDAPTMRAFLANPLVQATLPNLDRAGLYDVNDLHIFKGRFPRSLASHFYGDRYVMIGDAAGLVRAFKGKGVTSAVLTGIRAARTILEEGISASAFADHYRRANRDIIEDLPYGQLMRHLTINLARLRLLDPVLRAARADGVLQDALFDAVSAHGPYKAVLGRSLRPHVVAHVVREMLSM